MRCAYRMDTVQIELLNACINDCANCTRFCGHIRKPFYITFEEFTQAVDSMEGYPKMVGFQGGEPLLHPEFERFCEYARSKFPRTQLGLWTCLPVGKEHYRKVICETFEHIFINDHSMSNIMHHPPLVAIEEVITDETRMWSYIEKCWAQESWSASINQRGAWFCEIAGSMSVLFNEHRGWPIEKGWWKRNVWDFKEQVEMFCRRCGFACPVTRRVSIDKVDDISPKNLERLKGISRKVEAGKYVIYDLVERNDRRPMATYKAFDYRNRLAHRYGMFLTINDKHFWEPHLRSDRDMERALKSGMDTVLERIGEGK